LGNGQQQGFWGGLNVSRIKVVVTEQEFKDLRNLTTVINNRTLSSSHRKIAKARYLSTLRLIKARPLSNKRNGTVELEISY
jgi:hypothetical protein